MREHLIRFVESVQAAVLGDPRDSGPRPLMSLTDHQAAEGPVLTFGYGYFDARKVQYTPGYPRDGERPMPLELETADGVDRFLAESIPPAERK